MPLRVETPTGHAGHRIVLYGPGGIGKTTLADLAPRPIASFDLDDSLGVLGLPNTRRVAGVHNWAEMIATLGGEGWGKIKTIVIDTGTRAEEWDVAWTLANVPHEKGQRVTRIEDYGYGKGYQFVYETYLHLLNLLDQHAQAGRHVIVICHDCVTTVPNPQGEDWQRYEPRLQSPASGKASIRLRVREWADHLLFLGYDVNVTKGKATGSGTRTLYPVEMPHCMAKSRRLTEPMPIIEGDDAIWQALFSDQKES